VLNRKEAVVELNPFRRFSKPEEESISEAAERFGAFFSLPVTVAQEAK
jgi:hypothetical protein